MCIWYKTVWRDDGAMIVIKEVTCASQKPEYRAISIISLGEGGVREVEIYYYGGSTLEVRAEGKRVEVEAENGRPWFFDYSELRDAIYRHGVGGAARMISLTIAKTAWLSFSL